MKNNLGGIEMEQEFGDGKKAIKNGDIKKWPKYFGDFKNMTKYFCDIATVAKRKMVLPVLSSFLNPKETRVHYHHHPNGLS